MLEVLAHDLDPMNTYAFQLQRILLTSLRRRDQHELLLAGEAFSSGFFGGTPQRLA